MARMAVAAFVLSILALSFQFISFLAAGSRIKVELRPALLTHRGTLVRGPASGWSAARRPPSSRRFDLRTDAWIECAEITVSNVGRLPTSVHEVGLSLGPTDKDPWIVSLAPVQTPGSCLEIHNIRLEPGQSKSFVVLLLSTVRYGLANVDGITLTVRGHAKKSGRRRGVQSPQIDSWLVKEGTERLYPHALPTKRVEVFQLLCEEWPDRQLDIAGIYDAWLTVMAAVDPPPELQDPTSLDEVLSRVFGEVSIERFVVRRKIEQLMLTSSPAKLAGLDDGPRWI